MALILGHRRPRLLERLLFFLVLSLFAIYAGGLFRVNAEIRYGTPPAAEIFSNGLLALGLAFLLPLIWHTHYAYRKQVRGSQPGGFAKLLLGAFYLISLAELALGVLPLGGSDGGGGARLSAALVNFLGLAGASLCPIAFMDMIFEFQDWRAAKERDE